MQIVEVEENITIQNADMRGGKFNKTQCRAERRRKI
jgi:hypothetical protein